MTTKPITPSRNKREGFYIGHLTHKHYRSDYTAWGRGPEWIKSMIECVRREDRK